MKKAIINTTIIMPDYIIPDGVIVIDGDTISEFGKSSEISTEGMEIYDAKNGYTGPGLIDIHTHAGDTIPFDINPVLAAKRCLEHGITDVLPAPVYSQDKSQWLKMISLIKDLKAKGELENVSGLYMEGPYLNPAFGANRDSSPWAGDISEEKFKEIVDESLGLARVWCIAPERNGIEKFINYVKKVDPNVSFAVAHSEAEPYQIERFIPDGLKITTHHTNATGTIQRYPECRSACVDEATLYNPEIYAELICDKVGIHVEPYILRLTKKIKGDDKIILISDCSNNDGPVPDAKKYAGADDIFFDHLGEISGTKLTLDRACRNMMVHTGASLCQIFKYASLNPASAVGFTDKGCVRVGNVANLVTVNDKFDILGVYLNGKKVK